MDTTISRMVWADSATLDDMQVFIKDFPEVEAEKQTILFFSSDGGRTIVLTLSGVPQAIAKALDSYFRHRKKKFSFRVGALGETEVKAENYSQKDLVKLVTECRGIHEEDEK